MKRIDLEHKFKKAELEEVLDINKFNEDFKKEIEFINSLPNKGDDKGDEKGEGLSVIRDLGDRGRKILKDIYREIVKITHPDKDKEGAYTEEFRNATEFYETQSLPNIADIAIDLDIDISKYDIEDDLLFLQTEVEIEIISKKVNDVRDSIGGQWAHAKSDQEREILRAAFYASCGISVEQVSNYKNNNLNKGAEDEKR